MVRGSHQGESHGGVYLIDLDAREIRQVVDWNRAGIDWQGRGWDRGLRGIAFDGETSSTSPPATSSSRTRPISGRSVPGATPTSSTATRSRSGSARCSVSSTGFDAILAFDLDRKDFTWAMHVVDAPVPLPGARPFDPRKNDGPLMLNKLHLNNVHCTKGGMYLSGLKTGGMLLFNGREVQMAVELPPGTHNARPFRDGVLFNDTEANALRYSGRGDGGEDRAMSVPTYPAESLLNRRR